MSYILEALKKAQAERQLGELPTIHAPQLQAGAADSGGLRKPLWLALGASASLALVAAALWLWRSAPLAATTPAMPAASAAPVMPVVLPTPVQARPAPMPMPLNPVLPVLPALVAAAPAPVSPPAPAPVLVPLAPAARSAQPAEPPAPGDETVLNLRDLPEPIQKQIPPLTLGGYMYSKNPADRLLLIDKVLRHEGEEVAPGLILEKLLPKAAQFTFKGYRYRIAY